MATKTQVDGLDEKLGRVERSLKRRMGQHKTDLAGRIDKVATTSPTIRQFEKLKAKVDRHHPTN